MRVLTYEIKHRPDPCAFKGCAGVGKHVPTLVCPQPFGRPDVELVLTIKVCDSCMRLPKEAYVSDEGWRHLCNLLEYENKEVPPREILSMKFEQSDS